MKKVLIVVVVLLLLAAGYYFYNKSRGGSSMVGGDIVSGMMSYKDLLAAKVPQKCTYSMNEASGGEGTTYVSGGKVRSDFSSTQDGKAVASHMISDGTTSYVWNEGDKTGYKMTISQEQMNATPVPSTETGSNGGEGDINQNYDFKCSAWIPDNSLFNPPSDVTFTDFSSMMQPSAAPAMQENSGSSSQCSYCDSLSGNDKTQCLSALKCQ